MFRRLAIVSLGLVACKEDPDPELVDPRETLEACGLPEPCGPDPVAAYDGCLAGGFDEAPVHCVLAALSGTEPVHVSVYRSTVCGDIVDTRGVDVFRWDDGTATCVFWGQGSEISVETCDGLPVARCRDLDPDAPLPSLCEDWRDWMLQGGEETEAVCR